MIAGSNFGSDPADVRVYLSPAAGTIVLAEVDTSLGAFSSTGFTVRLSGLTDLNAGTLSAVVAVKGVKSASTTVATVVAVMPTVTAATFKVARSSGGNLVEIVGTQFRTDRSAISVVFIPELPDAKVVACTDTRMVVSVGDTSAVALGSLEAVVTHSTYGSSHFGGAVQVGTVEAAITTPFVQPSSALFPSSGGDLAIDGSGFGTVAADIRVYLMTPSGVYISPAPSQVTQSGGATAGAAITAEVKTSSPAVSDSAFAATVAGTTHANSGTLLSLIHI